ncbi:MAG: DUF4127 family protein [Firmicutes bacterium]|nr:DUF4127 family protein [Bacillota bacterium]
MKKVVYLPMDERPCNMLFPSRLFGDAMMIRTPSALGNKKVPSDPEEVRGFLLTESRDADGLILSMDQLLYGGLIPSRLHYLDRETVMKRLDVIRQIKKEHPSLLIYAYQCIMRCPRYSSSDEEPDYYADCGREIYLLGDARHRFRLGLCQENEVEEISGRVPQEALRDYLSRREFNLSFDLETLELVADGTIDFLVFPQDDSARYGFTAMDQEKIRKRISDLHLGMKVLMYPGADELGLTMMSRILLHFCGKRPLVYIKTAATGSLMEIPPFEDRPLGETIKYHLIAAGCRMALSPSEADIILGISYPGRNGRSGVVWPESDPGYTVERNLAEFVLFLEDTLERGKTVTLADNAYANGGDPELISMLDQQGMLSRLHGYSGWNTSSNTLGTAIAEGVHALVVGMTQGHWDFLALRYLEDICYDSVVRQQITKDDLPKRGFDYFNVGEQRGEISELVRTHLLQAAKEFLPSIADQLVILDTWMPWSRMFEVGLSIRWNCPAEGPTI